MNLKLNNIKEFAYLSSANAVRFITKDYDEYFCEVGDVLTNVSYVWKGGEQTNVKLKGLCFILIKDLKRVYYYDKLLFINVKHYINGSDPDEIIITNPKILAIKNNYKIIKKQSHE